MRERRANDAWPVDDLEQFAENDGNRYELVDGILSASPSPRPSHQWISSRLHMLLEHLSA